VVARSFLLTKLLDAFFTFHAVIVLLHTPCVCAEDSSLKLPDRFCSYLGDRVMPRMLDGTVIMSSIGAVCSIQHLASSNTLDHQVPVGSLHDLLEVDVAIRKG